MLLSNVFTIIGFVILIMMPQNDDKKNIQYMIVLPLALVGFAYCFYVSGLWPSIPYVVDKKFLGSAYGITTAIQNCGLAVGPLIAGAVTNTTEKGKHYRLLNFIQIAESAVGLVLAIWLWIYDSTHGGVLSSDSETAAKRFSQTF